MLNDRIISSVFDALWRASWQGGLALLVVWGLCRLWRGMPSMVQVWLWRMAFVKLVLALCWPVSIPVLVSRQVVEAVPVVQRVIPAAPHPKAITASTPLPQDAATSSTLPTGDTLPIPNKAVASPAMAAPSAAVPLDWRAVVLAIWLFGMVWNICAFMMIWRKTQQLFQRCEPIAHPLMTNVLADFGRVSGHWHIPAFRVGDIASPMLVGTWRPVILLPTALVMQGNAHTLRLILAHELAHIRHRDLWWGWVVRVAKMVLFFHPMVHWSAREWEISHEMACDAAAQRATAVTDAHYGAMLLQAAEYAMRHPQPTTVAIGFSESFSTLHRRLQAMAERIHWTRRHTLALASLLLLVSVLVFLPWHLMSRPADASQKLETRKRAEWAWQIRVQNAIQQDMPDDVNAALTQGMSIDARIPAPDESKMTLRQYALMCGAKTVASQLYLRGASATFGNAPLHLAAIEGDIAGITQSLAHSSKLINAQDTEGHTPLSLAVIGGNIEAITTLIQKGADVNAPGKNGFTPLHYAAYRNDVDAAKLLLKAGAHVDAIAWLDNGERLTPLTWAVTRTGTVERQVSQLLLQHGADINASREEISQIISISPDGKMVVEDSKSSARYIDNGTVISRSQNIVKVRDLQSGKVLRVSAPHLPIRHITWEPDNQSLLMNCDNFKLVEVPIRGRKSETLLSEFTPDRQHPVESVEFFEQGRRAITLQYLPGTVVAGRMQDRLRVSSIVTASKQVAVTRDADCFSYPLISAHGDRLFTVRCVEEKKSSRKKVRYRQYYEIFDLVSGKLTSIPAGTVTERRDLIGTPVCDEYLTKYYLKRGNMITVWDIARKATTCSIPIPAMEKRTSSRSHIYFSPDGLYLCGAFGRKLYIWDATNGKIMKEIARDSDWAWPIVLMNTTNTIVGCQEDLDGQRETKASKISFWDVATGKPIASYPLQ